MHGRVIPMKYNGHDRLQSYRLEVFKCFGCENLGHHAEFLDSCKFTVFIHGDTCTLLSPVLKAEECVICGGNNIDIVIITVNTEHTALVIYFVKFCVNIYIVLNQSSATLACIALSFSATPFSISAFIFSSFSARESSESASISTARIAALAAPSTATVATEFL